MKFKPIKYKISTFDGAADRQGFAVDCKAPYGLRLVVTNEGKYRGWICSHYETGRYVASGATRSTAVEFALSRLESYIEQLPAFLKSYGFEI